MADRAPFIVLVAWVLIAPILLGSVAEATAAPGPLGTFLGAGGGYALFTVLGLVAAALLVPGLAGRRISPDRRGRRMLLLAAILPALALFQLVPLPLGFHRVFGWGHARDLAVLLPEQTWAPVSTDPGLTLRAAVYLSLLLFAGMVTLRTVRGGRRAWVLLGALIGVAAAGAFYGLLETHLLGNRVLSHPKGAADTGVTGTFFYRGNFAAFSALAAGVAATALVVSFRDRKRFCAAGAAMALAVLSAGLLLSGSRAGFGAWVAALLVGFGLPIRSTRRQLALGALVLLGAAVAYFSFGALRERFEYFEDSAEDAFLDVRVPAWESTLELADGRPFLGSGLGTYRRAIHLTQSDRIDRELFYAHSDPLNLLAEAGAAGLLAGLLLFVLGLRGCFAAVRTTCEPGAGVGAACAAGLAGLLVMALVDFPLQIPAIALAGAVLLFLPAAARASPETSRRPRFALLVPAVLLAGAAVVLGARDVAGSWGGPRFLTRGEELAEDGSAMLRSLQVADARRVLEEARSRQPFHGVTRYHLAEIGFRTEGRGSETCRRELRAAHRLARGQKILLYDLGTLAYRVGERELAIRSFKEAGTLDAGLWYRAHQYFATYDPEMVEPIAPEREFAWRRIGAWYAGREEWDEAFAAWWKALDLTERKDDLARDLADAYRRLDREEEGRRRFSEAGIAWPVRRRP